MRVLHILDSLNRGGAEMLALDICRNAKANDLDLTFVATGGGDLEEDFRRSGVDYVRLQRKLPIDLMLVLQLRRIIAERKIQVVHGYQAVEGLHAYFATLGRDVRRVLSFQGYIPDAKNRLTLKFLIPRMNANIAVGQAFLDWLRTEEKLDTRRNFSVIYNGVDAKRLQTTSRTLRVELGLSEDHILLGMVGNFYSDPRKDQLTICKALPKLLSRTSNVHFVFVGGCPDNSTRLYNDCVDYCRQHNIADRVHFLGKRSDIAMVLNSLDVFVFSSLHEGLPIAVIEAMLMGIPTIISDIPPLLEVTGNAVYAQAFRTKDASDLTHQLIQLINNPAHRARLGAQGKQWAIKQFSIEAHISNLLNLYSALVSVA